jgi:hypothetical protein
MREFLNILESYEAELSENSCDNFGVEIKAALERAGFTVQWASKSPRPTMLQLTSPSGQEMAITVTSPTEDEELDAENDPETDQAAKAVKMADKATEDDPQTIQAKRNLSSQVGRTFNQLDRTLRDATGKLQI